MWVEGFDAIAASPTARVDKRYLHYWNGSVTGYENRSMDRFSLVQTLFTLVTAKQVRVLKMKCGKRM